MKTNNNAHRAVKSGHRSLAHRSLAKEWQAIWRRTGQVLLTLWTAIATMVVLADPQGGSVTFGEGNIGRIENGTTVINQQSDRMSIDWESFNVAVDERVVFQQPSSSATALNRIFDQNPSQIFGAIDANGRILLLNPNGILFGKTAQVNIQSLVASSLELSLEDFKAGNYDLTALANSHGSAIINRGLIQAASGGSVSLVGDTVVNDGVIVAEFGQVNLAAGRQATVDFDGDGLLLFAVDATVTDNEQAVDNAVLNTGKIIADGGQVLMAANTAQDVFSNVVNNTGKVRAMRIDNSGGVVRLIGSGGTVAHSGQIDVSSDDGTGGLVELTSERVGLFGTARIDASGRDGGGVVHIGGGVQGGDESLDNADYAYVSQDAIVSADAIEKGDGGEVVVWSDIGTRVHGELSARGGADGGDGGFIETSGKLGLVVANTPDVTAEQGAGGEWLIDPFNITIVDGNPPPDGINGADPFVSSATATIGAQLIADALAGGASVSVTTGGTIGDGEGNGDITLDAGATLNFDGGDGGTLTLVALNDIIIDGMIQDSVGADESLNLVFTATNNILINATGTISLGAAGTFIGSAVSFTNAGALVAQGIGGISLDLDGDFINTGTLNAGSEPVFVLAGGDDTGATISIGGTFTGEGITFAGGAGDDEFNILTGLTADLFGGVGIDTFNLSADIDGSVNGGAGNDIFNAISTVTGNLNGEDDDDQFIISSGGGAGALSGGAGDDVFDFAGGFNITTISGGADSDTLDFADVGAAPPLVITLSDALFAANDFEILIGNTSGTLVSGVGDDVWFADAAGDGTVAVNGGPTMTFSDFATLDAGGGIDTQLGPNQDVTWTVTPGGDLVPDVVLPPIASIEVLSGGTGVDTFNINFNYDGSINGGGGDDIFNLGASVTGDLNGNDDNDSFNVSSGGDANALMGNAGTDTLTVDDGNNNAWTINGTNSGVVDGQDFSDIENLIGGADDDNFTVVGAGTAVSVAGGTGGNNRLTGSSTILTNVWSVTTPDSGQLNGMTFSAIQTLQGGGLVDQFALGAALSGTVFGGNGNDVFTLSGTGAAATIDGQDGIDTLVGSNVLNTWTVNLPNEGTVNTQDFIRIENLQGGGLVDQFALGAALSGTVFGGNGNDVFTLSGTGAAATIDGQDGSDRLVGSNVLNTWTVNLPNEGTVNTQSFIRIENLQGGGLVDQFALGAALSGTVFGGNGNDVFTLSGTGAAATIDGQDGSDRLVGSNSLNTWTVNLPNEGTVNTQSFIRIENLQGGGLVDQFALAAALSGTVFGGNGNDVFTLSGTGAAATIDGQDGSDRLVGSNSLNTWTVNLPNEGTVNTQSFIRIENLQGGGLVDQFALGAALSGTVFGGNGNDVFTLSGTGAAATIDGQDGSDRLVGSNSLNTWTVNLPNEGTVNTQSFIRIENLQGGGLVDQFALAAALSGTVFGGNGNDVFTLSGTGAAATIDGQDGSDRLVGSNSLNTWTVNLPNEGTVNTQSFIRIENLQGGGLVDQFALAAALSGTVFGGNDSDVFTLSGTGAAATIDGQDGIDTLVGSNSLNTWTVSSNNEGTVNTQDFIRIESLTGGSAVDIFNITADLTGSVRGGDDADVFNIGDGSGPVALFGDGGDDLFDFAGAFNATSISGGADSDTVDFADRASPITVTLTDALYAPLDVEIFIGNSNATLESGAGDDDWFVDAITGDGTVLVDGTTLINFSAFTTLDAGLGQDSQLGPNEDVTWTVDVGGNLVPQAPVVLPTIISIEALTGGSGVDTFNIDNAFTGFISGGVGNDIFDIDAVVTGNLAGGVGNDSFFLNTGGSATSIDGEGDMDTLTGDSTIMNSWVIDTPNSGMVNAQLFDNIENLIGGALADDFTVSATLDGNITGGDGDNQYAISAVVGGAITGGADFDGVTLIGAGSAMSIDGGGGLSDYLEGSSTVNNTWAMQSLTTGILNGNIAYSNFEEIIGGAMNDTLIASNTVNDWLVDTTNAGTLNSLVFSEIENLSGGSATDNFMVSAQLDGNLDGNGGLDDIDILVTAIVGGDVSGGDNNDDIEILGTVAGNVSGGGGDDALDIDNVVTGDVLGDGGDDAIYIRSSGMANTVNGGDDTDSLTIDNLLSNLWEIQSPNAGTVAGQAFLNIENLIGNAGDDMFVMQMNGTVESIDGVGGNNTLTGSDDQINTWSVLTINAGELNGATFSNIQNLNGGALVDEFTLAAMLDGNLAAGGGDDSITLAGGSAASIDGGADSDTLVGDNTPNDWVVDAPNSGTVNMTQAFNDIENLSGGSAADTFDIDAAIDGNLSGNGGMDIFNLNAVAVVGGDVSGGDADDQINVDGTVAGSVSGGLGDDAISIRAAVTGNVLGDAGIDTILLSSTGSSPLIDGGDDADTLTYDANPGDTTDWVINADSAGTVNLQMFSNIENLVGDTAEIDSFLFTAAGAIGSIDGGTGMDDVLTGNNTFNVWNVTDPDAGQLNGTPFSGIEHLNGGSVTDIFTLSAVISGDITGGAGNDNFAFQGTGAAASIDGGADTDSIFGDDTANNWAITMPNSGSLNTQAFSNIENLNGGAGVDSFNIAASLDGDINGGGDVDVFTLAAAVGGNVSGEDGDDSFVLAGPGMAANIDGGNDTDSLTGSDAVNAWIISAPNGGTVGLQSFENIENLSGGSLADTFNINAQLDGAISGGGDADIFNLGAAVIGNVSGDAGGDSFVLQAGGTAANLDGGNDSDTLIATDDVNVWTVATANSGTLNMQMFANIENLTGGSMMDTFNVNAQLDGDIDGGDGMNVFALAAAVIGDITGGAGDDSFTVTGAGSANALDGGAGNNTLTADDIVNMWLVSDTNSGMLNTQAFTNVQNLNGGEAVDTFTVNAQLDGNISGNGAADVVTTGAMSSVGGAISGDAGADMITIGGTVAGPVSGGDDNDVITVGGDVAGSVAGDAGNDMITVSAAIGGNVTGDAGDDAITVNVNGSAPLLAGGAGNDTLTYDTMADNAWAIDAVNAGTVNTQTFAQMENLIGGAQVDTFNIDASVTGNIEGGMSNDVFTLSDQPAVTVGGVISGNDGNDTLSTAFLGGNRLFAYDGGAGTDAFMVSGNTVADYTGVFDASTGGLIYTSGTEVQQALLSNLESISDQVLADSLQINATADVTLSAATLAGQNPLNAMIGTLDFGFSNKPSLDLNVLTAGTSVSLVGAIGLPGTLDIDLGASGTLMSDQGLISADSLIIRNAQIVSDLVTDVGSMMFDMVSGMFTVDEADELELLSSDVNGSLTVNAGGALTVADGETVSSSNGLTLNSPETVSIDGNVSADNLAITANNMQLNGNVTGSTSANLNAGSITQGATGQLNSGSLTTTTTAGMSLLGNNAISSLNATNMGGDLVVNNASTSTMNITNSGGLVDINNAGNLTISGLTNNLATNVDSTNLTIAGNITTTGAAATTLTGSGAVMQNAVVSAVGDLFINGNTINVASTTNAQSSGGNVTYNGMGDVTVSDITAQNGSVLIASQMGDIFAAKYESAITSDNITFLGSGRVGLDVTPFAVFSTNGRLMLESPTDTNPNIDLFINDFGKFTTTGVRAINQRDLRAFATTSVFGQSLSSALSTGTDIDSNVFNIEQPDIVVPIGHGVTIPCGQIEDEEEACK